jgi:hypothetical protein
MSGSTIQAGAPGAGGPGGFSAPAQSIGAAGIAAPIYPAP